MKKAPTPASKGVGEEILDLVETLNRTERRLEELTGGQVDSVVDREGQTFFLRRAQEELRSSESIKQAAILNALPAQIVLLDTQGIILSVNESWRQFATTNLLQGPGFGIGQNYVEICERAIGDCSDEARAAARGIRQVLQGEEKVFALEYPCHSPTEKFWFRLVVTPVNHDLLAGAVVMHTNITERKLAAAEFEQLSQRTERRERLLSTALASMSDFAQIYDQAGRILFVNQPLLDLWGLTLEEVVGKNFADLGYPKEQAGKLHRQLQHVVETGEEVTDETPYKSPTGVDGYYEYIFSPAFSSDGKVDFVVGSTRDVTLRRQADAEIRFNEQRYRSLVEATTAIVWDTPVSGEFTEDQPGWTAFTGQTFAELRGWGWLNAVHPDDRTETVRVWSAAVANRSRYDFEHRLQASDKTYRNMLVRAVPILKEDGTIRQWVGVHTDITERKKLEHQLLRSQRMESIGTLAGGIAHDLNNILAPIMMSISILREMAADPEAKDILETIEISASRGADIVRQVLSFARGVEGERVEVQPRKLLQDLQGIIKDTFPKDIRLKFVVPDDTWTILGDPTQLQQILLNLCVNARDAMPNGGSLVVSVENSVLDEHYASMNLQAKAGRYVRMSVTDSGTGIPKELIEKIFEPFFTTKELNKGTGLGLSTVMGLVKSHDGIINVYSEPGKGTTFIVYLLAMNVSSEMLKKQTQEVTLPRGNGETILVVDDEASILNISSRTLKAFGYQVITAEDGADAVAKYSQHRDEIAVVLTDMMMPVMDGPATIRALQKLNSTVKIIAASGLNVDRSVAKATAAGVKHFLPKPYTGSALLKTLRAILNEA
jgi:PAS domain S-box-containing protein